MTILREQLDNLSASKESLLTYNQEQTMVASLQQQLSIISRKEPDAVKTEFTDANEVRFYQLLFNVATYKLNCATIFLHR